MPCEPISPEGAHLAFVATGREARREVLFSKFHSTRYSNIHCNF